MSRKAPDEKFHFGYHKVESLVAFVTSIGLMGVGGFVFYQSYRAFVEPKPLKLPALALAVLLIAGCISLYRALQMRGIAKRYNLSSLRLDANNAVKDGFASFFVFFAVLGSSLGFHQLDAVGGVAVGVFILLVSYVVLRETTLVLLDVYHNPELVEEIRGIVEGNEGVLVRDVLLRASGPYIQSEIHIEADRTMTVGRLDEIKSSIESAVKERFTGVQRVIISAKASPTENGR